MITPIQQLLFCYIASIEFMQTEYVDDIVNVGRGSIVTAT